MSFQFAKKDMVLPSSATSSQYSSSNASANGWPIASGLITRVAGAITWLAGLPRRRSVLAELSNLSEHELADIGLTRGELGRVFDADFAAERATYRASMSQTIAI